MIGFGIGLIVGAGIIVAAVVAFVIHANRNPGSWMRPPW